MENGRFTEDERAYLMTLDVVVAVSEKCIFYSNEFKLEAVKRNLSGEGPKAIFESVGMYVKMVGYKRMSRALENWRESFRKGLLGKQSIVDIAPVYEREPVMQGQDQMTTNQDKLLKEKDATIAHLARENAQLKMEVEALKELGRRERKLAAAEKTLSKSAKFELIHDIRKQYIAAPAAYLCELFDVSHSGYYKWIKSAEIRHERELRDEQLKELIMEAFEAEGFKKGSRQIRDWIYLHKNVRINRKCVQRIMRKYSIICPVKKKKPYAGLHANGDPKFMPNVLERNFFPGEVGKVFVTDITYVPVADTNWLYLSVIKDSQSGEVVAWKASKSLKLDFVMDCLDQLERHGFKTDAIIHSDQGVHYTSHAYHDKVLEMGLVQSMSRRGNCHDNACIESFFGRMKFEVEGFEKMTFFEAEARIEQYIEYYNNHRCQKRLGYITPSAYAKQEITTEKRAA